MGPVEASAVEGAAHATDDAGHRSPDEGSADSQSRTDGGSRHSGERAAGELGPREGNLDRFLRFGLGLLLLLRQSGYLSWSGSDVLR